MEAVLGLTAQNEWKENSFVLSQSFNRRFMVAMATEVFIPQLVAKCYVGQKILFTVSKTKIIIIVRRTSVLLRCIRYTLVARPSLENAGAYGITGHRAGYFYIEKN